MLLFRCTAVTEAQAGTSVRGLARCFHHTTTSFSQQHYTSLVSVYPPASKPAGSLSPVAHQDVSSLVLLADLFTIDSLPLAAVSAQVALGLYVRRAFFVTALVLGFADPSAPARGSLTRSW